jgi:RNA polymerase sigma-70 factor, ECF subfamily
MTKGEPKDAPENLSESAFAGLVGASKDKLFRAAARILGRFADAEDVVQETYMKAYDAIEAGTLALEPAPLGWLYRTTVNGALDQLRARKNRKQDELSEAVSDQMVAPGLPLDVWVAVTELRALVDALPPDERVAWILKEIEGHTSKEVGAILGVSEGAIEQRVLRARAELLAQGQRMERSKHA